jgi:hypothetical protein
MFVMSSSPAKARAVDGAPPLVSVASPHGERGHGCS